MSTKRIVSIFSAVLLSCANCAHAEKTGRFEGDVITKWNSDGRTMTLMADFTYIDSSGNSWTAKKGAIVDGASIPQWAWSIIGGPFEGNYRPASVIHDIACAEKKRAWRAVHLAFYEAMLTASVSEKTAKIMYAAVYHFGPKWETPIDKRILKSSEISPYMQSFNRAYANQVDFKIETFSPGTTGVGVVDERHFAIFGGSASLIGSPSSHYLKKNYSEDEVQITALYRDPTKQMSADQFEKLKQAILVDNISIEKVQAFQ